MEDCEQGGGETHPDAPILERVSEKVLFQGAERREGREGMEEEGGKRRERTSLQTSSTPSRAVLQAQTVHFSPAKRARPLENPS